MKSWYVVHTQVGRENLAAQQLRNQGFEIYFPRIRKNRKHARRTDTVLAPLFPRYMFVHIDTNSQRWRSINGTMGVSYIISDGENPLPVPLGVIENIMEREDDERIVSLPSKRFNAGDQLLIGHGPFADHVGEFEDMSGDERVVLLLNLLGRPVRVRVPIETISATL